MVWQGLILCHVVVAEQSWVLFRRGNVLYRSVWSGLGIMMPSAVLVELSCVSFCQVRFCYGRVQSRNVRYGCGVIEQCLVGSSTILVWQGLILCCVVTG